MIKLIDSQASQASLIRDFQTSKYKFKKLSLNLWFLQECKRKQVLPNFTKFRHNNNRSPSAAVAIQKAREYWLKEETRRTFRERNEISKKLYFIFNKLTKFLHATQLDNLFTCTLEKCSNLGNILHTKLKRKLSTLVESQIRPVSNYINSKSNFNFHPNMLNLSDSTFTKEETELLHKGQNFSFNNNSQKSIKQLIAHTDSILNFVTHTFNTNIDYNKFINVFKQCKFSVNGMERNVLNSIKRKIQTDNLIVTKADKGNCLVIQNRPTYIEKTTNFLNENGFTLLHKDPTTAYHTKHKSIIKNLPSNFLEHFSLNTQHFITPNFFPPRLYCLPKIHKQDTPYRPIVSSIGSSSHKLAAFLSKQLPAIINFKPTHSIQNSTVFCKEIKEIPIADSSILFSFDVVNLFNSIPTSDCLNILKNLLHLSNASDSISNSLLELTQHTLEQNFLLFNNKFYKQHSGLAMGCPLSPLLAEIFMDNLEQIICNSPQFKNVIVWKRYVDDIFGIFNGIPDQLNDFHSYLNTIHPCIKFTLETETNNSLPFLDIRLTKSNNRLHFNIYRKPTTTKHVIPFDSSSPLTHKLAAFRALFNRLLNIPLNQTAYQEELSNIFYLAESNKFPFDIINNLYHRIKNHHFTSTNTTLTLNITQPTKSFSLPYIPKISEQLSYYFKTFCPEIRISFSTYSNKLISINSTKDKLDPHKSFGIYKLNCPCGKFYIGRTVRNFTTRGKEHIAQAKSHLKNGSHITSAFSNHLINSGHIRSLDDEFKPTILHSGGNIHFLNSLECIEILHNKNQNPTKILNNITEFTDNHFIPYVLQYL